MALSEYRTYIEGCSKVTIITDHKPLVHIPDQSKISRRHVPWIDVISQYLHIATIVYRKGEDNESDPLSRRPDLMELYDLKEEHSRKHPELQKRIEEYDAGIIQAEIDNARDICASMVHLQVDDSLTNEIRTGYKYDTAFAGENIPPGTVRHDDGLYWIGDKIYVPNVSGIRTKILQEVHEQSGHPDVLKTYENLIKSFYWKNCRKDVKSYVKLCKTCQKIKDKTSKPYGALQPLPVPSRPWESVSLDFITHLPNVDGYDAILTVVCMLTKMAHFIPCTATINSLQLAKLFMSNVYRLHGLPRYLIGDRDTRYTSEFFRKLMGELRTKLCLSTAYHPQSAYILNCLLRPYHNCTLMLRFSELSSSVRCGCTRALLLHSLSKLEFLVAELFQA